MFDSRNTVQDTVRPQKRDLKRGDPVVLLPPTTPPKPVVIEVVSVLLCSDVILLSFHLCVPFGPVKSRMDRLRNFKFGGNILLST